MSQIRGRPPLLNNSTNLISVPIDVPLLCKKKCRELEFDCGPNLTNGMHCKQVHFPHLVSRNKETHTVPFHPTIPSQVLYCPPPNMLQMLAPCFINSGPAGSRRLVLESLNTESIKSSCYIICNCIVSNVNRGCCRLLGAGSSIQPRTSNQGCSLVQPRASSLV